MIIASSASAGPPSGLQTASKASSEAPPSNTHSRASSAPLGRVEHLPRPLQRRAQRALALRQVARAAAQQLQPALEALQQRRQRQQPRAVGGELDRQRQPVQARADLGDDVVVLGRRPVRARRGHARREQRRGVRDRQRLHPVGVLGGQPQRRAAGGEHGQVRRGGEQLRHLGGVGEEALEAVEHEQRARAARRAREPLAELGRGRGDDPERGRRRGHERAGVVDAGEIDVRRAAGEAPGAASGRPRAPAASCRRRPRPPVSAAGLRAA